MENDRKCQKNSFLVLKFCNIFENVLVFTHLHSKFAKGVFWSQDHCIASLINAISDILCLIPIESPKKLKIKASYFTVHE